MLETIELRNNWVWSTLEECVEILDKKRIPVNKTERLKRIKGRKESELVPYYGATGQVGWIDDFIFNEELVLLGEDGAPFLDPLKDVAYIIRGKSWVNNHAHVLKAIESIITNQYLCYYLNKFDFREYVTGTTRLKLNQSMMRKIPIPIPPLSEQVRIVGRVEELFSRLDAGVRSLQAAQIELEQYRQTTLKQAYTGKITQKWRVNHEDDINTASKVLDKFKLEITEQEAHWIIPDSWKWPPFKTIADINPKLPYDLDDEVDVTFIPMKAVEKETGKIDFTESRKYGEVKKGYTKFIDNDIIFAKITPCMENGKIAITRGLSNRVGVGSTEFHVIRMKDESLLNQFYYYFLLQKWFRSLAEQHFTGTVGHRRVPTDFMKDVLVPLPPFGEQVRIVEIIEECFSFINQTEINIENSFKKIIRLKQSILKKAFEGRLVPQDSRDEPVSVLLEHIKALKSKQGKLK